ncbi:MAG: hypothetical protein RL266_42 [Bacteroidota bacterium]
MNLCNTPASKLLQHFFAQGISIFSDLIGLFYPRVCAGCDAHLIKQEKDLCLLCLHQLPKTYFWDYEVSPVEKLFWGKIPVHAACSYLHFEEMNVTQRLMHRLKYDGKTGVGLALGESFASILKEKLWFSDLDIIIPVPLHITKEVRRGYNQCAYIAEGIANVYQVPVRTDVIKRVLASESQTRKSRYDRSENVGSVFKVGRPMEVKGKNVLLVDDVVTTGSTLEAAGLELIHAGVNKLYIATLAIA